MSDYQLDDAIQQYAEDLILMGELEKAQEFLQPSVFQMIYVHCEAGNARLRDFMRNLILNAAA